MNTSPAGVESLPGLAPRFRFLRRSGAVAAIHRDARAGDVTGVLARQKRYGRADFFRSPESAERHARLLHGSEIAIRRVHVGIDGTWVNHIHGDALRTQIARPATRVSRHCAFSRRIVGDAGPRRGDRGHGTDGDDATALGHQLCGFANRSVHTTHVDRELLRDVIVTDLANRAGNEYARVVHEDVQMTEVLGDLVHELGHFGWF